MRGLNGKYAARIVASIVRVVKFCASIPPDRSIVSFIISSIEIYQVYSSWLLDYDRYTPVHRYYLGNLLIIYEVVYVCP